jgi:hypothetical protein
MRTDSTQDYRLDPARAWTRERERYHRARALRLLVPAVPPVVLLLLLAVGLIDPPRALLQAMIWVLVLVLYGALWVYLIRDARRFVDEAAAMDQRYRSIMEGEGESASGVGLAGSYAANPDGPVIALAGRRIDARDAEVQRFPFSTVGAVQDRLHEYFAAVRPAALVCSAACGADLLALDAAEKLGVRRCVILPFDRQRFRHSSVTDRPGNWGPLFDRVLDALPPEDLVVLSPTSAGADDAYAATNAAILDQAFALAAKIPVGAHEGGHADVVALLVWDGRSRGEGDLTDGFRADAERRGLPVTQIPTL